MFKLNYVMAQHCPNTLAPAEQNSIFKMTQNEPKDQKVYNLHYNEVQGVVLRPPHGTTPAAVKISSEWRYSGSKELIKETKNRRLGFIESVHVQ